MSDVPPAEILRRARPIPTYRDHPATSPVDVEGIDYVGARAGITVTESSDPTLILFLSTDCLGCQDLWTGTAELRTLLPEDLRLVIVTKGPEYEDVEALKELVTVDVPTVMSTQAYLDYRVGGAPFLVVVTREEVKTEGVAWGIAETARTARHALGDGS